MLDLPIVLVSPAGALHTQTKLLGNLFNPSYQPVLGSPLMDPTVFSQRLGIFSFSAHIGIAIENTQYIQM
jgi:hypothetical protein